MLGITVKGKYAEAKIFAGTDDVEQYALAQVKMICDDPASDGSVIRVMPDVHPGKIGPIGLTMTVGNKIIPGLVGIDIGCGITAVELGKIRNDHQKLDGVVRECIPAGFKIRDKASAMADDFDSDRLKCAAHIRIDKAVLSLGTLGSGNHFIELDRDEDGDTYLMVHTGSRHLGKEVAEYYMAQGQKVLKETGSEVPYEMTCLAGSLMEDYLHDACIVQEYAGLNRSIIIRDICKGMKWKAKEIISCAHNYVDLTGDVPVLRKGAISAKKDETVIIPINMRDGVLIGKGLGNEDWNCSAPHGSGRIASREDVRRSHTVSEYKSMMKGVYSSCISKETLDEAPFAYRGTEYVREAIKDTVRIEKHLTPVYSFKGGSER